MMLSFNGNQTLQTKCPGLRNSFLLNLSKLTVTNCG